MVLEVGQRFDVVEVIASNYGEGQFTIGSHRIAKQDGALGFQVLTNGVFKSTKSLYLTTSDFIDNNKCRKVATLIITRVK